MAAPPAAAPPVPPPGRSGRDLRAAIAVGVVLGLLVIVPLYTYKPAFVVYVAVVVTAGLTEFTRTVRGAGRDVALPPLVAGGALMVFLAYNRGSRGLVAGLLLTLLAVVAWAAARALVTARRPARPPDPAPDPTLPGDPASVGAPAWAAAPDPTLPGDPASVGAPAWAAAPDPALRALRSASLSVFTAVYVPFLAGFCVLLAAPPDGTRRVTAFIATVVCSDVGGFAAGVRVGRHPLAPSVSPKKSWEGLGGSVLACVIGGALLVSLLLHQAAWKGLVYGVAVALAATAGDLAESLIKRDLGVKDMGHLLPGHGGVMDRLDSLLVTAPVAWLLLSALAPFHR
jgi:phosphatidate cytidylyltransferase